MVILSSYHPRAAPRTHVPITRWPFVFAKWRLRQASNSFTLPPFAALPSHGRSHPSRSSTSLPSPGGRRTARLLALSLQPVPRFFSLRRLARPSSSSTTTPPAPSLDHPRSSIPFAQPLRPLSEQVLSTPSSFPLSSSVTSMIILRPAINRARDGRGLLVVASIQRLWTFYSSIRSGSHLYYIKSDEKLRCFP